MKKIIYILLIPIFIISCSKEESSKNIELQGYWEWISSKGRTGNTTLTSESTRTNKSIYIGKDFISYYEGERQLVYTFVIEDRESIYNQEKVPMLVLEDSQKSFVIQGDVLVLRDEINDGFIHKYKKVWNMPCTEVYMTLSVKVKDKEGNLVALDRIKVTRLDTNTDITDRLVGSEWELHQKWGSYPIYNDFFVSRDAGKSLTINLKGYLKGKKVVDTNMLVGADSCHIFPIKGSSEIIIGE